MRLRLLLGLLCLCSADLVLARSAAGFGLALRKAHAEQSPYLARENPLHALLPSASALSARERERRERAIAAALLRLPHVRRAEALITQVEAGAVPLDLPLPAYQVQVQLEHGARGPSELEVERVVRTSLPALARGQLRIVSRASPADRVTAPALTRVGPFMVARESSTALRATLASCLAANALLAALLLARRRRGRAR